MPAASPAVRGGRLVQLIIFKLADQEFAAPIADIREIIRNASVTPVPGAAEYVKGMINVRGEIAVAIGLKARFALRGGPEAEAKHLVITAQGKSLFALVVDEVTGILRIDSDEVKPAPELSSQIDRSYIAGLIVHAGRLIVVLDLGKVLSEETLAGAAQARRREAT